MTDPDVVIESRPDFGHGFPWRSLLGEGKHLVTERTLVYHRPAFDRNSDDQL